jgi:AraC-like DNA-binding protein
MSMTQQQRDEATVRARHQRVQDAADELVRERLREPITLSDLAERTGLPEKTVRAYAEALWLKVES